MKGLRYVDDDSDLSAVEILQLNKFDFIKPVIVLSIMSGILEWGYGYQFELTVSFNSTDRHLITSVREKIVKRSQNIQFGSLIR